MGMVYCRGCSKEIHETARTCPHCGAPQGVTTERNTVVLFMVGLGWSLLFWFAILFLLGFFVGVTNPANAENAGQELGEAAAFPVMIISFLLAGILTYLGKLPGTYKKA